jgi:hypothetical protein
MWYGYKMYSDLKFTLKLLKINAQPLLFNILES